MLTRAGTSNGFLAATLAVCLSVSFTKQAQAQDRCEGVSAAELRARYDRAIALLPSNLTRRVPDAFISIDWVSLPGKAVLTNGIGKQTAVDIRTGKTTLISERDTAAIHAGVQPTSQINPSPQGKRAIRFEGFDLVLVDQAQGSTRRLTSDASADLAYGIAADGVSWLQRQLHEETHAPIGWWSPDGRYFAALRVDQRGLRPWPMVVGGKEQDGHRLPILATGRLALPGDLSVPTGKLILVDSVTGRMFESGVPPLMLIGSEPIGGIHWTADSRSLFLGQHSRDFRQLDLWVVDAGTGDAKVIFTDRQEDTARGVHIDLFTPIADGREFLLYSEREGRGHLFLHDARTGALKARLTSGNWSVTPGWSKQILHVDVRRRLVYFTAMGREPGRDPYYRHLYRTSLDGGAITLLTPEDADHDIEFSPDASVFIDRFATVSAPAVTVLRNTRGHTLRRITQADFSALEEMGRVTPQRFQVTAADGRTALRGTLFIPPGVLRKECVPIIDATYGGPSTTVASLDGLGDALNLLPNATAQLGFVVMQLDARGTPLMPKEAREVLLGRGFGSEIMAADHESAIRQLALRFDFIDPERAGIYGHSWGGYYTVRAMLQRPRMFKVGVASAGSHDNFVFIFGHDRWFGMPQDDPESYRLQSNLPLADRLTGKLLLAHGDADDTVHPLNTLLMAGALAHANRPFDMLLLPDLTHSSLKSNGYFIRRRWDYFVEHLLGLTPPLDVMVPSQ